VLLGDLGGGEAPSQELGPALTTTGDQPPLGPGAEAASAVLTGTRSTPPLAVGLGTLVLVGTAGAALVGWQVVARRRRHRRRIEARLEAYAGTPAAAQPEAAT
jgi:hypothetical protein